MDAIPHGHPPQEMNPTIKPGEHLGQISTLVKSPLCNHPFILKGFKVKAQSFQAGPQGKVFSLETLNHPTFQPEERMRVEGRQPSVATGKQPGLGGSSCS